MKSFKELDAIADAIIANKLPKEQVLFMNKKEKRETDVWLKNLGSTGVMSHRFPDTDNFCDKILYGNITFYLIDTGYLETEPHLHDWVESKTFFKIKEDGEPDDKYILSRYCKSCGKTETYHGKKSEWVETGYVKTCNSVE